MLKLEAELDGGERAGRREGGYGNGVSRVLSIPMQPGQFIQNCNQMFERVEQDEEVILINSDVICPNKNWIRELIDASEMSDKIGTVTPMSNCASIFSFPFPNHDNTFVTPDHVEEVNEALDPKIDKILMVPSCHGFCVLIRKKRLPF